MTEFLTDSYAKLFRVQKYFFKQTGFSRRKTFEKSQRRDLGSVRQARAFRAKSRKLFAVFQAREFRGANLHPTREKRNLSPEFLQHQQDILKLFHLSKALPAKSIQKDHPTVLSLCRRKSARFSQRFARHIRRRKTLQKIGSTRAAAAASRVFRAGFFRRARTSVCASEKIVGRKNLLAFSYEKRARKDFNPFARPMSFFKIIYLPLNLRSSSCIPSP